MIGTTSAMWQRQLRFVKGYTQRQIGGYRFRQKIIMCVFEIGVPAVIVAITMGVGFNYYGDDKM